MCDFYIGKKIFDEEKYEKLVAIRKAEVNFDAMSGFFPKYRADLDEVKDEVATEKGVISGCIVSVGTVVVRDIAEAGTYVGVPSRKIR